jgi:acetolactate synthase-1/2/3 large subunit
MNGADILCDTLLANQVDVCFANPGTSEMHFVAALDRKPQMRCILGLFEGVVTGAADGYARMADKPAATLMHLGPGLANGLSNLHNARRACSPVVNIVGDHATYHLAHDAPLTSDIEGLARPMSGWVKTIQSTASVSADAAQAIAAARRAPGCVSTLILPADAAWSESSTNDIVTLAPGQPAAVSRESVREVANAIRSGKKTMLLLAGKAARGKSLETASRIAQATGIRLSTERTNARLERGAGRVGIDRVVYNVDAALADHSQLEQVILVGAKAPVAFFAYPGKPGSLLPAPCRVIQLAALGDDLALAMEWLADEIGIPSHIQPLHQPFEQPLLPKGALTPDAIAAAIGHLMPENAIVCDESVSSGHQFFRFTRTSAPHDYLPLTGGSIGIGLPLATGAAVACPGRKIICLQADGSGMYTVQALWTQAREQLDVITIIFANRAYAILHGELKNVGAGEAGHNARRMLDLDNPALDWVRLAEGMGVEAVKAATAEEFISALRSAMGRRGPFLIEAII